MKTVFSAIKAGHPASRQQALLAILLWPIAGLFATCVAWFFLMRSLENDRHATERSGRDVGAKIALIQANQTAKNLAIIDQVLLLVRAHAEAFPHKEQLSAFMNSLVPAGVTLNISFYDADGRLVTSNTRPKGLDASPNSAKHTPAPVLPIPSRGGSDELFVAVPLDATAESAGVLQLSRTMSTKTDTFAGMVLVELDIASLASRDSRALVGEHGFIAAIRKGHPSIGVLLSDGHSPSTATLRELSDQISTPTGSTMWSPSKDVTGENYFLSWNAVPDFPIVVAVATDQNEALHLYRERENAALRTAAGATCAMLAFVLAAAALTARFELQRNQLRLVQAAYRTATEQGVEGFMTATHVARPSDGTSDYLISDCNDRGASFMGQPKDVLIGQLLSNFPHLIPCEFIQAQSGDVSEFGSTEFVSKQLFPDKDAPKFVSATIVKSDSVLAITLRDVTLEKVHLSSLERQTNEDVLTGLPNRAWVTKTLPSLVNNAKASEMLLALLFVDLDGFKSVNDTFGHAAGDELLKAVSERLKVAVRPKDHVARIGGDEFVIILEGLTSTVEAGTVAGRILNAFCAHFSISVGIATVGTSIGISIYPLDASDAATLLNHADVAMYAVKTTGKHQFQYFDSVLFAEIRRKATLEQELRTAVVERQFEMYYQPRVDVLSGQVTSMEALVRWNHPTEGLLGPEQFIPTAEESGLILQLGELIVDIVCAQIGLWAQFQGELVPVSINVSSRQFNEVDIHACIANALNRYELTPAWVEVELTESTMIKDPAKASACIQALHGLGIRLLVDDFGTGYSSLAMLQELDFDVLKVDKSFTSRLGVDHEGEIFVSAIITLAHALGMRVVAEGVESSEQLSILGRLQCDEVQGFFLFRPMPPGKKQAGTWLRTAC